ncbi:MAG: polysaccharide export protein [Geminicoccaceae bacterium]|nr:polysaccharide export protein [Geminicoccaceae bacterium]
MKDTHRTGVTHPRRSSCSHKRRHSLAIGIAVLLAGPVLAGCERLPEPPLYATPAQVSDVAGEYTIAPGDELQIFVWQDRDLSLTVRVRPDGRISMPLIDEIDAAGKTPPTLAEDIKRRLSAYVQNPVVTVIVADYEGPLDQQIRVIGEATKPQSLTFQPNMTLLDALIAVEGLTEFADGNAAVLVRKSDTGTKRYRVRLTDLLQDGDVSANAMLLPGDVLIVPETTF